MTMSRVEVLVAPASGIGDVDDAADPYRYGWRYVRCDREDGAVVMEQVPLTLEDEYDLAGVPLSVIVDMVRPRREPGLRLLAYTQTADGYQVLPPDERGWLWLAPAQLWLGVEQHEIVCYDATGQPLGDYLALGAALAAEVQAREAAEQRTATAEARVRELEAELQRLRQSRS